MRHLHGSYVHDHPGGEIPHDHPPPGTGRDDRGGGGWFVATGVLVVVGAGLYFLMGSNYSTCQSILVQSDPANDSACGTATIMHFAG